MSVEDFKCPECGAWMSEEYCEECNYEKSSKSELKKMKRENDVIGKE